MRCVGVVYRAEPLMRTQGSVSGASRGRGASAPLAHEERAVLARARLLLRRTSPPRVRLTAYRLTHKSSIAVGSPREGRRRCGKAAPAVSALRSRPSDEKTVS